MLSFKQLLRAGLRINSGKPTFPLIKVLALGKQFAANSRTLTVEPGSGKRYRQHIVNADITDDTPLHKSKGIKVSCTCPDFKYTYDWVLHQHGASNLTQSIDSPPIIRNSAMSVGVCKHITVVLAKIAQKGM